LFGPAVQRLLYLASRPRTLGPRLSSGWRRPRVRPRISLSKRPCSPCRPRVANS